MTKKEKENFDYWIQQHKNLEENLKELREKRKEIEEADELSSTERNILHAISLLNMNFVCMRMDFAISMIEKYAGK